MVSDWQEMRLADCMEAIIDYRGKTPKKTESGIPLITAKIIKNGRIETVSEFIAEDDYDSWMRRGMPLPGDIVMTTEAPLGEIAQLDNRKIALAQRVITLRGKQGVLENTFLKYLMQSNYVQHQLDGRGTGTTVKGIKQSELREVLLKFPPIPAQKQIANILGSLDEKIETNRQTNQTLEAMAQALFKSWFVDFDPVIDNALVAGHEIPEPLQARAEQRKAFLASNASGDTLPESIRQLFPNRFVLDAEMGWIPEGWETQPVSLALIVNPKVKLPKGTLARYVDMKALPTSGYSISEVIDKEYSGGAKFEQYDVLLARITPCLENGKTGFVDFLSAGEVGFGSTEFIVLRQRGHIGYAFVACLSREESFRQHCVQNMVGSSGRQRVQNSCFDSYRLALPSENDLLSLFESQVKPMFAKKSANKNEIVKLVQLRDTLLPKLISGELRLPVPEAEDIHEQLHSAVV
ncbi:restriction endonuclease subunit S [Endozoicomonas atrinae]|uniref:restriction endonuclease subunit S n=1 Tax=Endozoicomonas atrinae TaxID=1333660 RepID=UPI0008267254|nr:restriction endonuclease subunit S [Endozoicomonas atrinae]